MIHAIAAQATIDQVSQLEAAGYPICNSIAPAYKSLENPKLKTNAVPQQFPFDKRFFNYSYALKYCLLNQAHNTDLISYIFSKMNLTLFKPFLFEILCLVGKTLGTKHQIFRQLL